MNRIPDLACRKCGGDTHLHFVPSSGMDIEPRGMFRTCVRCGYREPINSLDNDGKVDALINKDL